MLAVLYINAERYSIVFYLIKNLTIKTDPTSLGYLNFSAKKYDEFLKDVGEIELIKHDYKNTAPFNYIIKVNKTGYYLR